MGSLHNMVSVCSGPAGAVPGKNGFREGSGNRSGNRFRRVPGRFREPFREPVPMGSEVRIGSRARGSRNRFQGSEVWIGSKVPRLG